MQKILGLSTMREFARIRRGIHPDWTGDRVHNSECFLRQLRRASPVEARILAYEIECNLETYSEETGLPTRTLEQAQRFLYGIWS